MKADERRFTDQQLDSVIDVLRGTCGALESVMASQLDTCETTLTTADALYIDQQIFCCEDCGWWCDQSEMAQRKDEQWVCDDCTDDDDRSE